MDASVCYSKYDITIDDVSLSDIDGIDNRASFLRPILVFSF